MKTKMKSSLEKFIFEMKGKKINELQFKFEEQKKKMKNEESLRNTEVFKAPRIGKQMFQKERRKQKKITAENFPDLVKNTI